MFKFKSYNDERIEFTDGTTISYCHIPDCCEHNYADFSALDSYVDTYLRDEYESFDILPIDGIGFVLSLKRINKYDIPVTRNILIPCYSEQNGYYSTGLTILVDNNGEEIDYCCLDCKESIY